jgi:hypothetical protein
MASVRVRAALERNSGELDEMRYGESCGYIPSLKMPTTYG